jgi:hypothetical protein
MLREIAATLDMTKDTLVVFSDHGQIDQGGHGGQDPITLVEPFVMVGSGVKPGPYGDINMVDVAPTLAVMLGANIPATAQGEAKADMISNPSAKVKEAESAQQIRLLSSYETAIDVSSSQLPAGSGVEAVSKVMAAEKAARQKSERTPRFVQAGSIALLPLVWMWMKRNKTITWCFGAGLIYVVAFNVRYALLDQKTYSLSSVKGSADLILYCAITAAVALLIAMVVYIIALKPYRLSAQKAAEKGIWMTLVTLYLLALPVLYHYALNGLTPVWTLPDYASMFMGFLSMIQILAVSIVGLVYSGLLSLSTLFFRKKA